eukprot:gene21163-biopygen14708
MRSYSNLSKNTIGKGASPTEAEHVPLSSAPSELESSIGVQQHVPEHPLTLLAALSLGTKQPLTRSGEKCDDRKAKPSNDGPCGSAHCTSDQAAT